MLRPQLLELARLNEPLPTYYIDQCYRACKLHTENDGANFMKSIQEQLLQNLDFPCAIVMDNANYHSTQVDNFLIQTQERQT